MTYPYEHARGAVALADYLVENMPTDRQDFELMADVARRSLGAWVQLLRALLGDIAAACLAVENALRLRPLDRDGARPRQGDPPI